jgi:hypothetical protein
MNVPQANMQDRKLHSDCKYQMWNFETSSAYVTKTSACAKRFLQAPFTEYKYKYNKSHVTVRERRNNSRLVTDRSLETDWQMGQLERETETGPELIEYQHQAASCM